VSPSACAEHVGVGVEQGIPQIVHPDAFKVVVAQVLTVLCDGYPTARSYFDVGIRVHNELHGLYEVGMMPIILVKERHKVVIDQIWHSGIHPMAYPPVSSRVLREF